MTQFDDIRPYNDDEVRPTLDRILNDPELSHAVAAFKFPKLTRLAPWLICPLVKRYLAKQVQHVTDIHSFQAVIERYMQAMIDSTVSQLSVSGLDKLDPEKAYLFVSNHRDIAMDPALVNWVLFHNQFTTLRIAIGDNLLTKPYVSDLMRLNKSFIVNRSAASRKEKLQAAKHLSHYIHHSITQDKSNIWIAQREGRAKDGVDVTNSAIISMFALNRPKEQLLHDYISELNIVPVAISYEWDPCDEAKARELYMQRTEGKYEKGAQEDIASIAKGIAGQKGRVHLAFGDPLRENFTFTDEVARYLDQSMFTNYVLHPSNVFAYEQLHGHTPDVPVGENFISFAEGERQGMWKAERAFFQKRLAAVDERWRDIYLAMYANPIHSKEKSTRPGETT